MNPPSLPYANLPNSRRLRYTEQADGAFTVEILSDPLWRVIGTGLLWLAAIPVGLALLSLIVGGWKFGFAVTAYAVVGNWRDLVRKFGPPLWNLFKSLMAVAGVMAALTIPFNVRRRIIRVSPERLEIEDHLLLRMKRWEMAAADIEKISLGKTGHVITIEGNGWRMIALENPADAAWLAQRLRTALKLPES